MADQRSVVQSLTEFARSMSESFDLADALTRLTDALVDALGVTGVGISVTDGQGVLRYATASNELVTEIERVQEKAQMGPCYEAYRRNQPVLVPDIEERPEWVEFTDAARRLGLTSVAGVPMAIRRDVFGAVNLYEVEGRSWTPEDVETASLFADMAAGYLLHAALEDSRRVADQLQSALDSRIVVEQAKGVLATEWGVHVDEAFAQLRRVVRQEGLKLREAAQAVVDGSFRPPPPPPEAPR